MWVLYGGDYEINSEWIEFGSFVGTYASEGFGQFGMTFQQVFNAADKSPMGDRHTPQVQGSTTFKEANCVLVGTSRVDDLAELEAVAQTNREQLGVFEDSFEKCRIISQFVECRSDVVAIAMLIGIGVYRKGPPVEVFA